MPSTIVIIPGLHCASCATLIKDVSSEFREIQKVEVDLTTKKVTVEHGEGFDLAKWKGEIEGLGTAYAVHPS